VLVKIKKKKKELNNFLKIIVFAQAEVTVFTNTPAQITEQLDELGVRVTEKDVFKPEAIDSNCHLVIAVDQLNNAILVKNAIDSVKVGGCLLFVESKKPTEKQLNSTGLELVANLQSQDNKTFVLLRKVSNSITFIKTDLIRIEYTIMCD
jgi:hypothetical protein